MPAQFGHYNSEELWSPDYGDIDWKRLTDGLEAAEELGPYQAVGFDSNDGLLQELTQENLIFRTSDVAPYMDMIAVGDPRDGMDYIWFREDGPDKYEDLIRTMGAAALLMHSRFPLPDTVRIYLDRRSTGMDTSFLDGPQEPHE